MCKPLGLSGCLGGLVGGGGGGSCIIAKKRGMGGGERDRAGERERCTVKCTFDTAVRAPDTAVQPNVHLAAVQLNVHLIQL